MALYDVSTIQTIATALGEAHQGLIDAQDLTNSASVASKTKAARLALHSGLSEGDWDDGSAFETILRTAETGLTKRLSDSLVASAVAAETYIQAQKGVKFRDWFKTGVTWNAGFRALWRYAMREEIIVRLGTLSRGSSAFASYSETSPTTIAIDSLLELRTASDAAIGAADIILTLVCQKANGSTELATITVPALTPANTAFPVNTTSKYKRIVSITATGGTSGDDLEVWVR